MKKKQIIKTSFPISRYLGASCRLVSEMTMVLFEINKNDILLCISSLFYL